jgi:hypothetical protein
MTVAWHEVPGIAADYDPSRRDGMIERDTDDVIVKKALKNATEACGKDPSHA